jgi:MFS transporter, DHA1 family, inner membrane transport protein
VKKTFGSLPIALFALGAGGFGIGLTEFAIVGLLPNIAHDLNVSTAKSGLFVSMYALSVALGGIFITTSVSKLERKKVLMSLMLLFIAGNLISGLSHTFDFMLLGRVVGALCHGAFFGIGAVVASGLVTADKKAAAVSIMLGGLTVANILGVPFGTWFGQHLGWRATFLIISGVGVVALLGILIFVPVDSAEFKASRPKSLKYELSVFKLRQVWLSLFITIFGFGGMFGGFTYIAFTLTRVSQFAESTMPILLFLFGVGVFVGNFYGGRFADKNLNKTLVISLTLLFLVLVFFALTAENKICAVISLMLMGVLGFAPASGVQIRVMKYAKDAPTLASGANIASFNIGNTLGAWLGGLFISLNYGYKSPLWSAAGITFLSLVTLYIAKLDEAKSAKKEGIR